MRAKLRSFALWAVCLGCAAFAGLGSARLVAGEPNDPNRVSQDTRAFLVITGMRLEEDAAGMVRKKDLTVAEDAAVRVTKRGAEPEDKHTALFGAGGLQAEQGNFSADFAVDLDATYDIVMTFKDGTVIRVEDCRLPKEWRTHFYFHSTRGTKSPASVLRVGRDAASRTGCYIYAVFPLESYRGLGDRQLP